MTWPGSGAVTGKYVKLNLSYPGPDVFFALQLFQNLSANPYLMSVYYTMTLNGAPRLNSSGLPVVYTNPQGSMVTVEFFNWISQRSSSAVNTLQLNITEVLNVGGDKNECDYTYNVNFINPATFPATVVGDPDFHGLRRQRYQVHGLHGQVYNIISDPAFQMNALFSFLPERIGCPIIARTGERSSLCWSHPGTYLQKIAFRTRQDVRVLVESSEDGNAFHNVIINDQIVEQNGSYELVPYHMPSIVTRRRAIQPDG